MKSTMNSITCGFVFVFVIIYKAYGENMTNSIDHMKPKTTLNSYNNNNNITDLSLNETTDEDNSTYYYYDVYDDVDNTTNNGIQLDFNTESEEYEYVDQYYDSYGICTHDVLYATHVVKILSPSQDTLVSSMNHWTVVPLHRGGSVTVAKRDNVVAGDIFQGGCGDLEIFQTALNITTRRTKSWCHENRLLPCDASMQMAYHIFGYSSISEPGKGIDVVYTSSDAIYEDTSEEKQLFSMYYFECGGKRIKGEIRSPVFPDETDPYKGSVSCKWELDVGKEADYGIVRFSQFKLPICDNHHLVIEEDTIIEENDVTDSLLEMLRASEHLDDQSDSGSTSDQNYEKNVNGSQLKVLTNGNDSFAHHDDSKNAYFYRDSHITKKEAELNPKAGIHVVVITQYCGDDKPTRTFYWRRGSKNVTLTYVSENQTLQNHGFVAKFSVFSWKDTMKDHHKVFVSATFKPKGSTVPDVIFNYIILVVFVPIGLTIGLGIIIFHIKKRGVTIQDFYRKERKEMKRLRRANTERVKSCSPQVIRPARRAQSVDYLQPRTGKSGLAERGMLVRSKETRRGSLLNVRFFISGKKSSLRLKTVLESTSLVKTNETTTKTACRKSGPRDVP